MTDICGLRRAAGRLFYRNSPATAKLCWQIMVHALGTCSMPVDADDLKQRQQGTQEFREVAWSRNYGLFEIDGLSTDVKIADTAVHTSLVSYPPSVPD